MPFAFCFDRMGERDFNIYGISPVEAHWSKLFHAFPTFKLVNREGNILDVNADPRDLDALERVVKQL